MDNIQKENFYNKVIELFQNAKKKLSVAVNMTMVYSYYEAGRMIIEEEQSEIELIMIVFTDQEDVSDEEAEQYVQLLYDGKRPENVEVRPFLNLRKTS